MEIFLYNDFLSASLPVLLLHAQGKKTQLSRFCGKIGFIASCPGKKDPTSTLLRQNRFYCFMPGEKRLDFHAFAAKSVLLRHAWGKRLNIHAFTTKSVLLRHT